MNNFTVVSINSLKENQKDAAIRVIVVRQGNQMETHLNSKSIRKLIFMDEQGDMIHGILFKSAIQQFQDQMHSNNTYLIFDPIVKHINKSFPNVNPKLELIFQESTRIEVQPDISYALNFSFSQFADIKNNSSKDEDHDVIGIVKRVKHLVCFKTSKKPIAYRREIILINPMLDTITLTLWDDLAFNEGLLLESMETEHPVIAFFNMKAQSYQGVNQLLSFSTTGMLLNPICNEAKNFISWLKTDQNNSNLDMMYMEKMVSSAKTVTVAQLQKEIHTLTENHYYCLEGIISKIENKSTPWYDSCENCLRAITKTTEGDNCIHCIDFNSKIIPRYRLSLTVQENDLMARITLFEDIAAILIGFPVQEFIDKTLKDEIPKQYLQQLEEQNNVKHKFLFKLDYNVKQHNGTVSIIAEGLVTDKKLQTNAEDVKKRKSTSASSPKENNSSPHTRKARKKGQHNKSTEKQKIQSIDIGDEEKLSTFIHRSRKGPKNPETPEKQDVKIKKKTMKGCNIDKLQNLSILCNKITMVIVVLCAYCLYYQ